MIVNIIGLGKMGYNLALNMRDKKHEVIAFDLSNENLKRIEKEGIKAAASISDLLKASNGRKIVWIMVPSGKAVDKVLDQLLLELNKEDIVIDGGNSHYKDTLRRAEYLEKRGINYVDIGTSGGMDGARSGVCAMIGAKDEVFEYIEPLLKDISVENGYLHTGPVGSGHYAKMVHNGIEYGMMQAIGEGFEIMEKSPFNYDLDKIAKVWNNGSVIRSWLMELTEDMLSKDPKLSQLKGIVDSSGEGLWTLQEALELGIPVPVIAESLMVRLRSKQEDTFSGKVVAALRNEFGGHNIVKSKE
jgi:6-phosphogluconate dehydrogenase